MLTLKVTKVLEPLKETTFPPDFKKYFYTMYMYTNHNYIPAKK